jgi:cell growth-regulating nucleolar protein
MTFDRMGANGHTRCVTEHEKYALGATKPGGFAAGGFSGGGGDGNGNGNNSAAAAGEPSGLEFLAERPPWRCSACNVTCTSRETLLGHAAGQKHRRRARAAAAAAAGGGGAGDKKPDEQAAPQPPTPGKADDQQEEEKPAEEKEEDKKKQDDGSSDSSDSDSDSNAEKKTTKKRKRGDGDDNPAAVAVDKAVLAKVLADARKKLAAKGKLKLGRLRDIVTKRLKRKPKGEHAKALEAAAVAELQRAASADGRKRARLGKDKLTVV